MRVDVFGTGALAMLYGARLAAAGMHVELIGTWPAGLRSIREAGIRVQGSDLEEPIRVGAVHLSEVTREGRPRAPLVLVLVKSHQTPAIAPIASHALERSGNLLTLQNGLSAYPTLRRAAPRQSVLQGVTTQAARVTAPGVVRAAGGGATVLPEGAEPVVDLLETAGFSVRTSPRIESEVWRKVAASCAINPLTALHKVRNGALLDNEEWRSAVKRAAREVGRVAAALGVPLEEDPAEVALGVARRTRRNRSSMLQDLDRGARTEIDALCGAVVEKGRATGVETPVNCALWRRIREIEQRSSRPAASRPAPQHAFGSIA